MENENIIHVVILLISALATYFWYRRYDNWLITLVMTLTITGLVAVIINLVRVLVGI